MSTEPQRQKEPTPNQDAPAEPGPDRNDIAIEPQVADVGPETEKGGAQKQGQTPAPSQSQSQSQTQSSGNSAYVPDHELEGKKTQEQRNHQQTQGVDADIDTQGG
ncbi:MULTISPECIES: hypothetical protein [Pseudomonas syringae group]|uniref:Uncharacterized protein n=1 Tax=Pseudomonas coronafaciens pv. porri TaxID=83964 RepID=A0ABR5JIM8_9PSED|nr:MULTISPECIES: hypothetical protein [Pseudomonas syringae group]KOP53246.1 hypothetical protein OX90_22385 [Pseudomonas coronafaciens pv. porri]KOP54110.1 hypothetical protein OX88_19240 [Pseudomonas coronafaciens pv. porri]KPX33300.1 Uncharacterized protein ALO77_00181 [Pseudomonas coronafaciens pv. garcae]KPY24012.1 Uncharacterized protein ALO89_01594 [Pseudomonas coronafaciens pv. porri]MCF5803444.1 hypothetical protein [Pseudomonas tremae]